MKHSDTTHASPKTLTLQSETSYKPLWKVESHVLGTAFPHTWGGEAATSMEARALALAQARRDWPGFSFCVRSILQVA